MRILLFTLCLLLSACQDSKTTIADFEWLVGDWYRIEDQSIFSEKWKRVDALHLQASGSVVKGGETIMQEQIVLEERPDGIYFIPTVMEENEDRSVEFKLVDHKNGEFVFENKDHDFPQRIIYAHPHPDTLDARIEGMMKGKLKTVYFKMGRK
jgi:hypothetical protein